MRFAPGVPQPITLSLPGDALDGANVLVPKSNHIVVGINGGEVCPYAPATDRYTGNGYQLQFLGGNVLKAWRDGVALTDGTWSVP